jgi:hypothetical protein
MMIFWGEQGIDIWPLSIFSLTLLNVSYQQKKKQQAQNSPDNNSNHNKN